MTCFVLIKTILQNPKLSLATIRSKILMSKYKRNCFKSKTIKTLFTPEYTYKGDKPNTIFCIDRKTNAPVEITIRKTESPLEGAIQEDYRFFDKAGNKVGYKYFSIEKDPKVGNAMFSGAMESYSEDIIGIGTRADQIQIERALELGITKIPRNAVAQATLFHAKMGFLPIETELIPITSYKMAKEEMKCFDIAWNYITEAKSKPIIQFRDGKFYLDLNRTNAYNNLQEVQELKRTEGKIRNNFIGNSVDLELSDKQLRKWKTLIGANKITSNLQ